MKRKTIFCDIDGTIVRHFPPGERASVSPKVLANVKSVFGEWIKKDYQIILISGRKESERAMTEKQLSKAGIIYDQLILGIGSGQRIIINDSKPEDYTTCIAMCLERNAGFSKKMGEI